MRPLRVGIVGYPTYGGSGIVATELAQQLAARGHAVHLVSYDVPVRLPASDEGVTFHGVEVPEYPLFRFPPYLLALANKLVELGRYERLDVIHAHYAIPHAVAAYLAREILGGRPALVTTLHGTDVTLLGTEPSFYDVIRFALDRSDALTAVSRWLREETERLFAPRLEVEVVHNFIDPGVYRRVEPSARCRSRGDGPVLIHISNFRPVKRVPAVLDIFARVHARRPAWLWLVGDGPDSAEVHRRAAALGLADRVVFWGKQSSVVPLLSASDVLLLPSRLEAFGLAALEAMACEVPVVGSRVGGLPEVVEDGVTGFLQDPEDLDGMAESCLRLLEDPGLHRTMAQAARERAVSLFAAERVIPRYEEIYYRLAGA